MNKVEAPLSNKTVENIFVIMLIGIIICFVFPIVQNTIYKAQLSGIESSVYGNISSVELLYIKANNNNEALGLPFTVKYTEDAYIAYVGNKEYSLSESLTVKGRKPISGKIIIGSDGQISVENLQYEHFICDKAPNDEVNCVRNS